LKQVEAQFARGQARYTAARKLVVQIVDSSYEDSASTSLAGLLTSNDPGKVLSEASIVLQVTGTRNLETEAFLADAAKLSSVQQEQQRTEAGIAQLAAKRKGAKDHIAGLLSKQKSILGSLTNSELTAVERGTVNGGGGTTNAAYAGPTGSQADTAVAYVFKQLGCPYNYGHTGPCSVGFDCSGLVMEAWAAAGITIPRDTYGQWAALPHVSTSDLQPGDLLYYNGIGHVAMYVGGGMIIDAPSAGQPVREIPMSTAWYASGLDGAARPLPPPGDDPPGTPRLTGDMRRTLIVTNDFPPRRGGIQSFVHELALRLDPERLTVYAPRWDGDAAFDAAQPFEVVRHPTSLMIGGPGVRRRAAELVRSRKAEVVIFGAAAPLGLIMPVLRDAGAARGIAITHGHEAGWAALPVARQALRQIGERTDAMTYLGEYLRVRVAGALTPQAAARMARLHPGVDAGTFRPDPEARRAARDAYGLAGRPVVVCVSRLVARKGQDTLLRAWPAVLREVPDAALLIVGGGPQEKTLHQLAARAGLTVAIHPAAAHSPAAHVAGEVPRVGDRCQVHFAGPVPQEELPAHYAAGDVFAMPCRTRRGGLDVEGLGIVYLEASATGLPVVGGDSGGAPDAILAGETGCVVGGRDVAALGRRLVSLLRDPAGAKAMGEKGRAWVEREWSWDLVAARLRALIDADCAT
ncbi:MAG: glycosyltransferase, partial [Trebonia sp.]